MCQNIAYRENEVKSQIISLGFCGNILKDLLSVIHTVDDLNNFTEFIMCNENTYNSNLGFAKGFRRKMLEDFMVEESHFVEKYCNCKTLEEKRLCLQELVKMHVGSIWVDKLDDDLEHCHYTLSDFYCFFVNNKNLHIKKILLELKMKKFLNFST